MTNNLKSLEAQAEKVGEEHGVGRRRLLGDTQKTPTFSLPRPSQGKRSSSRHFHKWHRFEELS